eukprot:540162-Prymnesium_polylepis.1
MSDLHRRPSHGATLVCYVDRAIRDSLVGMLRGTAKSPSTPSVGEASSPEGRQLTKRETREQVRSRCGHLLPCDTPRLNARA